MPCPDGPTRTWRTGGRTRSRRGVSSTRHATSWSAPTSSGRTTAPRGRAREPGNGKPLLQGFPAVHDPRHRPCTPPVGRRARHRPHRHARRKFGRGIPGHRMGGLGAGAHRQTDPDRHGGQGLALDDRHRPDPAHGHRGRHDVRRAARRRRDAGLAAARALGLLTYRVRWDTTSRSRTRRNSPQYTAHRPTSNIRARNSAGATTPTRTMPYSTPSTPTTRGAGAAG